MNESIAFSITQEKKQNADPMIKEIIAERPRKLRESSTINLESSKSQNQQHSTSNIQTRKRSSTAIEIMPPAPKKQRHEDISTSSRGDLPPQSPGMQAVHRLLEKINKKTNQVDPLKKKLP